MSEPDELTTAYVEHLQAEARHFEEEAARGGSVDLAVLRRRIHRIGGTAGSYGFDAVSTEARLTERVIENPEQRSGALSRLVAAIRAISG